MGTDPHRRRPPFDANSAPARLVKALAIPGKTGFTSFGKVDLPFHAPVSQQSTKTRRHSSTGLEFHDHQENSFTSSPPNPEKNLHSPAPKKKLSFPFFSRLCPANSALSNLDIFFLQIYVPDYNLQIVNAVLSASFTNVSAIVAHLPVQLRANVK